MPFPAAAVGLALPRSERTFTTRSILAYAAGLGADHPAYLDDAQPGGLRALPFQCVSAEWPCVLGIRELLADSLTPDEARRGVHAAQDSIFHRPIRPGDRIVTEGRLVSARAIRSGVLTVCKLESRVAGTGELVTTSWSRSAYRDVRLKGEASSLETPPDALSAQPPSEPALEVKIPIPRGLPHVYSECADIWNPIHTERAVALEAGLPDIILHGTATWALVGLAILDRVVDRDVGRIMRLSGRFTGMVFPNDTITVRLRHAAQSISFDVRTGNDHEVMQGAALLAP